MAAAIVAGAVILGASACGGNPRNISADPQPATVWDKITSGINDDGTVGLATALAAFSYAVTPLPGVDLPEGEPEDLPSASGPVAWLLSHFDELTVEQKLVVGDGLSSDLVPSPGGSLGKSAPGRRAPRTIGCYGQTIPAADSADAGKFRALVDTMIGVIGGKLGRKLNMTTYVRTEHKANADSPKSFAYTWVDPGTDCASAQGRICQIHLNPKGQATSGKDLEGIIAHEVMHCFVFQIVGMVRGYEMPAWLGEGLPAWVGEDIAGGTALSVPWWKKYLTRPRSSLFKREYDAIGIYAQARLGGVDVWKQAATVLNAFDSEPAFNALVGSNESILDSWASGFLRDGTRGSGWDLSSPGITGDKATPVGLAAVGNGGSVQLKAAKVTTNLATVSLEADIVDITVDGHARLSLADKSNEVVHGTASWCLRSDRCACPGAADSGLRTVARGAAVIAVTGGLKAGSVTLKGHVPGCKSAPASQASGDVDKCVIGSWTSTDIQNIDTVTKLGKALPGGVGVRLTITASGAVTLDHTGSTPLRTDVGGDIFGTKLDGVGHARITAREGVFTLVENDFSTTVTAQQITPLGPGLTQKGTVALGTGPYTCAGGVLRLTSPYPLGEVRSVYAKS
jgi:hypothetical protein